MQLQNIQALPYGITKVSNFNIDNPYVPYLEVYNCDDYETTNLGNYLELYSYTINRIGHITDYLKRNKKVFIKATLIRDYNINDDSHLLATISDELSEGVYIGG